MSAVEELCIYQAVRIRHFFFYVPRKFSNMLIQMSLDFRAVEEIS